MWVSVYPGEADMLLVKYLNICCSKMWKGIELLVKKFIKDVVHLGNVSCANVCLIFYTTVSAGEII